MPSFYQQKVKITSPSYLISVIPTNLVVIDAHIIYREIYLDIMLTYWLGVKVILIESKKYPRVEKKKIKKYAYTHTYKCIFFTLCLKYF